MRITTGVLALFLSSFLWVGPSGAQTTSASMPGVVNDTSGAALVGAQVTAINTQTEAERSSTTSADGSYQIPGLPPGTYNLRIEKQGFKTLTQQGIVLEVTQNASINIALEVGTVTQSLTVTAAAPLLNTTDAQVSGVVTEQTLTQLPLNGRDLSQLIQLQVGVAPTTTAGPNPFAKGDITKVAVNGTRPTMTNNTLDGGDINDPGFNIPPGGTAGVQLGVDAIEEYRVILNPYDAQYGRNAGANVQYVTKSGTNAWHGTLYEFLRNSVLDASNFFDITKPRFIRNQFGAAAGGPIIRDKTFFFANYEGLRDHQGLTTHISVPDDNAHNGLLPSFANPNQLVFVGVNPTSAPLLALYPHANGAEIGGGLALFTGSFLQPTREDFGVFRIDHKLSETDQLFGRYLIDDGDTTVPNLSTPVPGFPGQNINRDQYLMLSWQHTFSQRLINDAKFSYNRTNYRSLTANQVSPSISLSPGRPLGDISISGIPTIGNNLIFSLGTTSNVFEGIDNVTYIKGSHTLRFGADVKRLQINGPFDLFKNGGYFFFGPASPTSNNPPLEAFLLGEPTVYFGVDPTLANSNRGFRQTYLGFYLQDDWKVSPRLTINLGVRWEYWQAPSEAHGLEANIRNIATDAAPTPGKIFANAPLDLWSPRIGFAWQPFSNGKTVVRGGFGIIRDQLWENLYGDTRFYEPFYRAIEVIEPNFLTPPPSIAALGGLVSTVGSFGVTYRPDQPYYEMYNLSIEHQLTSSTVLQVGFSGNHGVHLVRSGEANPVIDFATGARINPNFGSIPLIVTDAISNYNALQLSLLRRFTGGLTVQSSYTFAKALDDQSGPFPSDYVSESGVSQNFFNRNGDYGRSSFDRKNVWVSNFLYELPLGPGHPFASDASGLAGKIIGGWRVGGILSLESGPPFTLNLDSFNNSGNGASFPGDRPNVVAGLNPCSLNRGNPAQWFNPGTNFTLPPADTYGDSGRNTFCGPSLKEFDFTISKQTRITERFGLEFRAEFFNLFNHPNFNVPVNTTGPNGGGGNGDAIFIARRQFLADGTTPCTAANDPENLGCGILAPNVGRIFQTVTTSRQIQFGLKLTF
jgi:Carboxypeptidase regulatory-like domain/TonB dependent receptor-like, beta-barrel